MVKIPNTETHHEVATNNHSYESSRQRQNMSVKKCRFHKKMKLENLQKKAETLELQQKLLIEQRDRLKSEGDALIEFVKTHSHTCSGILKALQEYATDMQLE